MASELKDQADFYYVYIKEAHPQEGWSLGSYNGKWDVNEPTSFQERRDLAVQWHKDMGAVTTMLIDGPGNEVNTAFAALPERTYVLNGSQVVYQSGPGPFEYSLDGPRKALDELLSQK